ncbi:MAG TPA: hypothetical protein VHH11_16350 [Gammaproteobacteria bacterium]|jgi:hypothetical protein|nr:hypothetical protein [Gammaproteobacteria bacterium]
MKKTFPMLALAVVSACGATAFAQAPVPAPAAPPRDTLFFVANAAPVMQFGAAVQVVGFEGAVPGAVVTGKPYAADAVTERTQVLADGNRITARNEARFVRDSKGRTRREQTLRGFGPASAASDAVKLITLFDPVADSSYLLNTSTRTAQPLRPLKIAAGAAGTFTAPVPPPLPPPPEGGAARTVAFAGAQVPAGGAGAVRVELQSDSGGWAVGGAPVALTGAPAAGVPEDLGEQVLEGVLTHGTRRTVTIPAGAMGNERPIEIVSEQWYSPELETVVLRRNYDPRVGETTYRLVNLVRGEQSPDLFAVPQGYTLLPEPWQDQGVPPGAQTGYRAVDRSGPAGSGAGRN